ncbi:hypothetical protein E1301_Tti013826 [Triplophysa tibetana]|uniref:Uncharacterized protein n=1 Tax=Triplophysa tibetana TaxID=1572043 RepID=A0A5A9P6L6_9TELE|nr:hypothetical protein E1301_Tti013826 [Triplophysa tibetana]
MGSQPRERRRKCEGERETGSLITVISFDRSLAGFAVYGAPAGSPEVKRAGRCPGWELARRRESEGERAVMPEPITRCRDESHTSQGGCELISTFERRREEEKIGWGLDDGGGGSNGAKECFLRRTCEAPYIPARTRGKPGLGSACQHTLMSPVLHAERASQYYAGPVHFMYIITTSLCHS